jgi:prophage regulatory protein
MELDRMLRIAEVLRITGVSAATIWRWVKESAFPAPVRLGANSVAWKESDVCAWLESREPVSVPGCAALDRGAGDVRGPAPTAKERAR